VKIKKDEKSFGDYRLEISYGQLVAIRDALTAAHAEPMADELLQEINFYLENVPGPGESKEEFEQREAAGKEIEDAANLPVDGSGAPGDLGEPGVPSAEGEADFAAPPTDTNLPPEGDPGAEGGELPPPPSDGEEDELPVPPAPAE